MEGPRGLEPDEFDSLCILINNVFRNDGDGKMEQQYPLLFDSKNFENLLVMVDNGIVVSHVGTLTRDISICGYRMSTMSIGAVATNSKYRRKGLATLLMKTAVSHAENQDTLLMFISGGRGLYTRLGAKQIGRYTHYAIPRGVIPFGNTQLRMVENYDLTKMTNLYAQESSRYIRSNKDLKAVINAQWICDRAGEVVGVYEDNQLVAYAGIQKEDSSRVRLVEISGSRSAIMRGLPSLYDRYGVEFVEMVIAESDIEMASLVRSYGIRPNPLGFPGTILVLQPEKLLKLLDSYIKDVLGQLLLEWEVLNGTILFKCGGQHHIIERDQLGAFVFGTLSPQEDPITNIPDGPLRNLVQSVFPLQIPLYGFNYV